MYTTLPQCDRLHVLDGLQGGQPRHFRVDSTSERIMRLMDVLACDRRMLVALPRETVLNKGEIDTFFLTHGQQFKPVTTKRI